ncbi:sigma-70 family RNA polymerase sigma factor [Adhaeretor mobilis]|uniref:RNA polymerase sigma factor RpoD n=1 Tax=Adhaeretor mobilis TaxID=1930276 RepID=A0A517N354_9BACT|nr:sigma-70 family RNA polymerase sigma factor [Adhaeretor mobilis]QDT01565.1 RNA polymerase sigma factor RpoD [Adhaeretor mobilis]
MHNEYKIPVLEDLRDSDTDAPLRERLLSRIDSAERLIAGIDADKTYKSTKILTALAGDDMPLVRPRQFDGGDLLHDLRLYVEDLSDAAELQADSMGEQVFTVEELANQFNVSTKTISRWRALGLVSRRLVFDGRKRVGFLRSSVDRFVKNNAERVERGSKFSQLTDSQRHEFVARAKELANNGSGQAEIARLLAERSGRSVETIRTALRQHDIDHPEVAIFPAGGGPLTEKQRQNIYQAYRRGTNVDRLCSDYDRTKTTVYRVINEIRAERIMELPLDHMENPRFKRKGADKACLGEMPEPETVTRRPKRPTGLPPYLAALYEMTLLTREQEQHIFRKYNYLKYKAYKLRAQLEPDNPKTALMDEIEDLYEQVLKFKNQIIRANLRLVVSIAKRHVKPDQDFFALVSDGNVSLLRAIEKFDYARGNKFSTYASWAIMKNFARTIPGEYRQRDRFRTSHDELFAATQEERGNPTVELSAQEDRVSKINRILSKLDEREQAIIVGRFGLDHSTEPKTLKQVGADLGVTKERIRQIEARALNKLRQAAADEKIALDI